MLSFLTKELTFQEVHRLLLGGVAPRPIALVSTISKDGINNLSPFSFFNAFGANPPIIAFSPSRRGRNASLKDTYYNLMDNGECVVQAVTYSMVEQISLASAEYPSEVDEFIKSGLTPIDSDIVKPKRVKESPFQMECKLRDMMSYGDGGASANIAICEVIKFHVAEDIIEGNYIHPDLIDLAARMSAEYYVRASGDKVFEVQKPTAQGIGFDNLPATLFKTKILTKSDLAKLANRSNIPSEEESKNFIVEFSSNKIEQNEISDEAFYRYLNHKEYNKMLKVALCKDDKATKNYFLELTIHTALDLKDSDFAWKLVHLLEY
ncbi:MAG TPA: flavin reductase family protein [Ignavibacteriaceae bacterium]|nr:flavin reductase family protein [Ignavibacteriaceae bacterium]